MPGAEGAEAVRVVWEKDLVLEEAGTMRRDYRGERSFSDSPGERRGAGSTREEGGTYHLGQSISGSFWGDFFVWVRYRVWNAQDDG
jgi:hypothetical protein